MLSIKTYMGDRAEHEYIYVHKLMNSKSILKMFKNSQACVIKHVHAVIFCHICKGHEANAKFCNLVNI